MKTVTLSTVKPEPKTEKQKPEVAESLISVVGEISKSGTPQKMAAFSALESVLHDVKVRVFMCKKHAKGDELKVLEKIQSML